MLDDKKSALLIGEYTSLGYHPLNKIDKEIADILKTDLSIIFSEDKNMLNKQKITNFDLCISYADNWDVKTAQSNVAGLLSFVGNGGGFLVIHNGISLQSNFELAQLIGAKFIRHPPYTNLSFAISNNEHPIIKGIKEFQLEDEPYQFQFDDFTEKTVFLEYLYEGSKYPAAWSIEYGLGRIVYLMPGHNIDSFKNSIYRQIIKQSAKWALKLI